MVKMIDKRSVVHLKSIDGPRVKIVYDRPLLLLLANDPNVSEMVELCAQEQGVRPVRTGAVGDATNLISDMVFLGLRFDGFLADLSDEVGLSVIEEFRSAFPRRPVVYIAANRNLSLAIRAHERGIPVFEKPLDRPLLVSWLRAIAASVVRMNARESSRRNGPECST